MSMVRGLIKRVAGGRGAGGGGPRPAGGRRGMGGRGTGAAGGGRQNEAVGRGVRKILGRFR